MNKFIELKNLSGSHSPSLNLIKRIFPNLKINVDACFLSNPYATSLFFKYFEDELIKKNKLKDVLEYYPSQNNNISRFLSPVINIDSQNILIGNGAIQIIEELLVNHLKGKVGIPIPTFSSYYEILEDDRIHFIQLKKEYDYKFITKDIIKEVNNNNIKILILINPNNPSGDLISNESIKNIINECKNLDHIILDESFVHFKSNSNYEESLVIDSFFDNETDFEKIIGIKSLSKDFGIAGVRAGYGLISKKLRKKILKRGFLWNSNGIAEYFFELYSKTEFQNLYKKTLFKYLSEMKKFQIKLNSIKGIKVIPSSANFFLIEILNNKKSDEIVEKLLFNYGIYVRTCSDKIGLDGEYIRVASRTKDENKLIYSAFKQIFE